MYRLRTTVRGSFQKRWSPNRKTWRCDGKQRSTMSLIFKLWQPSEKLMIRKIDESNDRLGLKYSFYIETDFMVSVGKGDEILGSCSSVLQKCHEEVLLWMREPALSLKTQGRSLCFSRKYTNFVQTYPANNISSCCSKILGIRIGSWSSLESFQKTKTTSVSREFIS